jgi:hypothetical protein
MKGLRFWDGVSAGIMLLGAAIFGWQVWAHETLTLLAGVGLVVFGAGILTAVSKVRCPFCGRYLGISAAAWKFCPHCGDRIG